MKGPGAKPLLMGPGGPCRAGGVDEPDEEVAWSEFARAMLLLGLPRTLWLPKEETEPLAARPLCGILLLVSSAPMLEPERDSGNRWPFSWGEWLGGLSDTPPPPRRGGVCMCVCTCAGPSAAAAAAEEREGRCGVDGTETETGRGMLKYSRTTPPAIACAAEAERGSTGLAVPESGVANPLRLAPGLASGERRPWCRLLRVGERRTPVIDKGRCSVGGGENMPSNTQSLLVSMLSVRSPSGVTVEPRNPVTPLPLRCRPSCAASASVAVIAAAESVLECGDAAAAVAEDELAAAADAAAVAAPTPRACASASRALRRAAISCSAAADTPGTSGCASSACSPIACSSSVVAGASGPWPASSA